MGYFEKRKKIDVRKREWLARHTMWDVFEALLEWEKGNGGTRLADVPDRLKKIAE